MTAPKRKIVKRSEFSEIVPRGGRFFVYLECGHIEQMTRTEANKGFCYCWDCYYQKPTAFDPEEG